MATGGAVGVISTIVNWPEASVTIDSVVQKTCACGRKFFQSAAFDWPGFDDLCWVCAREKVENENGQGR